MSDQPTLYQESTGCDHAITGAWNCYECGAEQRWVVPVEPVGTLTVTPGQVVHVFYDGGVPSGNYLIVKADDDA